MRDMIRKWLGYDSLLQQHIETQRDIADLASRLSERERKLGALYDGLGRVIAKLDPNYGLAEDDPKRKAESDALGEAVITKLQGEYDARNRY